mmetsp:Transcript_41604/g.102524  ORF Transcript_41604/g.102524 Transcript_41604/m.102524 type:complete len:245 (-) Transcript_41604:541-1275(-)
MIQKAHQPGVAVESVAASCRAVSSFACILPAPATATSIASLSFLRLDSMYTSLYALESPRRSPAVNTSMSHSMLLWPSPLGWTPGKEVCAYVMSAAPLGPKYTCMPLHRIMALLNRLKAYAVGEWMVAMMVVSLVTRLFTTLITSFAVNESSPLVGSSRNSTEGLVMSAMAMLVRFFCPPLMPLTISLPTTTSRASHSPSSLISLSTSFSLSVKSSSLGRLSSAVYSSISRTVRAAIRVSNCST